MKSLLKVAAAPLLLLALLVGGCKGSEAAEHSAAPTVTMTPIIIDGIVVNELEVLEGNDPSAAAREVAAARGVLLSRDARLGTLLVWFPTRSTEEINAIKDALAKKNISANLVFQHVPLK